MRRCTGAWSNNMNKRTLLIIVDWFYPGYRAGGPIQSCTNLVMALRNDYNIKVLTSDTDHLESKPYPDIVSDKWNNDVIEGVSIYYMSAAKRSPGSILTLMKEADAEFIYLNHLFSPLYVIAPLYYKWRNKVRAKFILCPRGALFTGALNIKSYKKKPFLQLYKWLGLEKMVRFHATNEMEKKAILQYYPGAEVFVADNLPKLIQQPLQSIGKAKGNLKLLYIARIHPIKNLKYLLECLRDIQGSIEFVIIGPIEDESYWQECNSIIKSLPGNIQVNYSGAVENHKLDTYFVNSHLFVLPTKGENFGHSIFESFISGRPVLISDLTPWKNLYFKKTGWELPLDANKVEWKDAIREAVDWSQEDFDEFSKASWIFARSFINNPELKASYISMIA